MRKRSLPYVLSLGLLALMASCGSDNDDDDSDSITQLENGQSITYRAVLEPVNGSGANGTVIITRDADQFEVEISMAGAPSTVHAQHIHTGSACPTAANAGADQIVDAVEAEAVTGKVLIPLDSDISSRDGGSAYPSGSSYHYDETTSWVTMLTDLATAIVTPGASDFATIPSGQSLRLTGRVIEIHGTTASLPETVAGAHGETAARSLPIACGVLVEIPPEE